MLPLALACFCALQVAAYTNGRSTVSPYDCLLLQHCLWQRPEERERIYDYLLDKLSTDANVPQFDYLFASLFGRGCM